MKHRDYRLYSALIFAAGIFLLAFLIFETILVQIPGPLYHRPKLISIFKILLSFILLGSCFYQSSKLFGGHRTRTKTALTIFVYIIDCLLIAFLMTEIIGDQTVGIFYHRPRLSAVTKFGVFIPISLSCFVYSKYLEKFILWLYSAIAATMIISAFSFTCFPKYGVYTDVGTESDVFKNKKVLIIVPHQDDDVNLMGGTIEQFTSRTSEVYVAFTTNGDFHRHGETRLQEAIRCLNSVGVPENHVYFLGYGDQWEDCSVHIYNMPENQPMRSAGGYETTYGLANHPAFHEGNLYTFGNYLSDMKDLILECEPEYIFCVDYDGHIDHRATSLTAEKAIGRILQENPDYRPIVLKGFCYSTAWTAVRDFYSVNIKSTQAPYGEYMEEVNFYRWDQRLRLPMDAQGLSRSIFTTSVYSQLYHYKSQNALSKSTLVCNGDKVFWQRSTESLAYQAHVTATSGESSVVNDFMLHDTKDLYQPKDDFGIWVPDEADSVKQITVQLPKKSDIAWIYLYDNPSLDDNIEAATIILDDGRRIPTGKLDASGCATKIQIDAADVQSVIVEINQSSGSFAGLSEIELYVQEPSPAFNFIKLMDHQEDFVYDYYMSGDSMELQLYRCGAAPELSPENYILQVDNDKCHAEIDGGCIQVFCPRGQQCTLSISDIDGVYQDAVLLHNQFHVISAAQMIENLLVELLLQNGLIYKIHTIFPNLFTR